MNPLKGLGTMRRSRVFRYLALILAGGCIIPAVLTVHRSSWGAGNGEPPLHVSDGDTLVIDGERIRLWGMDAPEFGQKCQKLNVAYDCGITAREVLISLIGEQLVVCRQVATDRYGRTVARCSVNGEDPGEQMGEAGWALDFSRYSDGYYAAAERRAHRARRGLWGGQFDLPWEWRQQPRPTE